MQKENTLLIGSKVLHGSPGYENMETITRIKPKGLDYEVEFESGCFTIIGGDYLYTLQDDGEVTYRDGNHGGITNMIYKG